jgi:ELWxxDGT repeat protein
VKDIRPGSYSSTPAHLANLNGTLFFAADDGILGHELWKSDGTAEGTVLVKDIRPGGNSEPADLTNVNGTLFFMANDGILGHELWKSDGTAEGTVLVKNINPGSGSSIPHTFSTSLTNVNGTLFFGASEGVFGRELWRSDGAEAGTVLVKDINSGTESSIHPHFLPLMNVNGTLFVSANNGTLGEELWALNVSPEAPALSPILTALLAMSLLGAGFTFARTRGPKAR